MNDFKIGERWVGDGHPAFVIAELSANHGGDLHRALALIERAGAAGADAIKLQTYRPETMTLDLRTPHFMVDSGTIWAGRQLFDLYAEAMTPWEWYPELAAAAAAAGMECFSSPFDTSSVDFLVAQGAPALKIASFELVDLPLVGYAAATGLPLIMSTGMATVEEIDDAVRTATEAGSGEIALLRCNSAYPATPAEMDLRTIADMARRWPHPVGLSDHTLGTTSTTLAIAFGASVIEKHFTMARADGGPDAAFSLEPHEFSELVSRIRESEHALGTVRYGPSPSERPSLHFRRSLHVVAPIAAGGRLTGDNVRSLRPAGGLPPKELPKVIGMTAARDLELGTPLAWEHLIGDSAP